MKTYITPTFEVVNLETEQIIAMSLEVSDTASEPEVNTIDQYDIQSFKHSSTWEE